jgi:hypothetical protein
MLELIALTLVRLWRFFSFSTGFPISPNVYVIAKAVRRPLMRKCLQGLKPWLDQIESPNSKADASINALFSQVGRSAERLLICAIRIGELSNRASAEYKRLQAIRKWCGQSNEVSAPCRGAP